MKLPHFGTCLSVPWCGNKKRETVMGEIRRDELSDRGSIPLRSIFEESVNRRQAAYLPFFLCGIMKRKAYERKEDQVRAVVKFT